MDRGLEYTEMSRISGNLGAWEDPYMRTFCPVIEVSDPNQLDIQSQNLSRWIPRMRK